MGSNDFGRFTLVRLGQSVRILGRFDVALWLGGGLLLAQSAADHPDWPGKGQLFVGTCC